jgi:PUA domain protein
VKKQISVKEANTLLQKYNILVTKQDTVSADEHIVYINNEPCFFYHEHQLYPTLKYLLKQPILKTITVDMGAVRFVVNGADIMRPGIVAIDANIQKDEAIIIIDQNNKKPLAVGIALLSSEEMQKVSSGKVIKNIHYAGDEIWKNG